MVAFMEKAKASGVSMTPSLRAHAIERSKVRHGGNLSGYVQELITRDLSSAPAPTSFDDAILTKLATTYAGYFAPRLAHALESAQVDQPKALHGLLSALCEHLARGCSVDDLVVCPRSEWQPEPALMAAAEAPAPYGASPAPASPLAGMTKAQFKAQKPSNPIFSSESAVDRIAQEEAARREAAARKHGANPQKPHP